MKIFSLRCKDFYEHFPIKTLLLIVSVWLLLVVLNYLYIYHLGTDWIFPFSVLYPSDFLWQGFLFSGLFGILGVYFWNQTGKFSISRVLLCCIALVVVGNMMQGSFDNAFLKPFYWKGRQYYSDAIKITNPSEFIRTFHEKQDTYLLHTRTHPPFVVLLHYYLLKISGGSIAFLSVAFTAFSMLIFPIMMRVWQNFDFSPLQIKKLLLFLAVLPSVNIYSLVSLDGLILVTVSLSILAISEVYRKGRVGIWEILLVTLSITLSNALSFSGLFIIAFLGVMALVYLWKKDAQFLWLGGVSVFLSILFYIGFYHLLGYNHWEIFRTASASENPNGFMLFSVPIAYFATRLQAIGEILMFLSLSFLTLWFHRKYRSEFLQDEMPKIIATSAIFVLLLMFSTGAYGTGETARACLFIVPFIFILIKRIPSTTFSIVYFLCLLQTLLMQTVGNFYW